MNAMGFSSPIIDLYFVSCGIDPFRHATIESIEVLRHSASVITISSSPVLFEFLEQYDIKYCCIADKYVENTIRTEIYREVAAYVVSEAVRKPGTCYLTYGHPLILDEPVELMLSYAREQKLLTRVIAGVSFIDAMLVATEKHINTGGFSLMEATDMVSNERTIDSSRPLIVAQIGSFGSEQARGLSSLSAQQISPLVSYLLRFYPEHHMITLIDASTDTKSSASVSLPLCLLPLAIEGISYATSIYLPQANGVTHSARGA